MAQIFDLSSVKFVKRVIVGQKEPSANYSEEEAERQLGLLNKCLNENPKGHIIACEKNFILLNVGEHQVVQQFIVYHVAFDKKPLWLS